MLETAVALADRHGLEALSMRRLADELGAGAMSLYHYVPNKEQLIDGMVDIVFGEIAPPSLELDWKTAMRRRALSTREVLNRHRWAVGLMEGRMNPGPAGIRVREAILGCLREAGFSIEATIQAYSVQDAYIYGFALQERSLPFESAPRSATTSRPPSSTASTSSSTRSSSAATRSERPGLRRARARGRSGARGCGRRPRAGRCARTRWSPTCARRG